MKHKKILLLMLALTIMVLTPHPSHAASGSWVNMSTTENISLGSYDSGTKIATEDYYPNPQDDTYGFSGSWVTDSEVPSGSWVTNVRVKIYFKAYYYFLGYYYTESIDVAVSAGTTNWFNTYSPSDYLNGGYIYIYLGTAAKGKTVGVYISDAITNGDSCQSSWYIGRPLVQYYSTVSPW